MRSRRGGSLAGPLVVMGVLFAAVAAIVIWNRVLEERNPGDTQGGTRPSGDPGAQVDPFFDLPDEEPPPGWEDEDDPFREVDASADWDEARELAETAARRIEEAVRALDAGDREAADSLAAAGGELLERALEESEAWEAERLRAGGEEDPEFVVVRRTRDGWRRELRALEKAFP